ncbi:Hypothetical protein, putative [Bodo saltans]|uniref:Uncharacterized protein n=1 Tax=Bodo saltans TaxID=75058 RepID=A0A0S4KID8_BODSA|nr:Hypothetical protein, putative [Bodo saltans]|eukprot:CUI15442.1 Hypothetical protein, putative [Bodo saltans]
MQSASYTCPACGVPFSSPAMLENHQRRFCLDSRVDREAANILANVRGGGGGAPGYDQYASHQYMGAVMIPPPKPPSGMSSAPPRMYAQPTYPTYAGGGGAMVHGGALPGVDFELFQLIRTQQQQIALMQGLMNSPYSSNLGGGPRLSPRQQALFPPVFNGGMGGGGGIFFLSVISSCIQWGHGRWWWWCRRLPAWRISSGWFWRCPSIGRSRCRRLCKRQSCCGVGRPRVWSCKPTNASTTSSSHGRVFSYRREVWASVLRGRGA